MSRSPVVFTIGLACLWSHEDLRSASRFCARSLFTPVSFFSVRVESWAQAHLAKAIDFFLLLVVGSYLGFCRSRGFGFVVASSCISSRSRAWVSLHAARILAHFPVSLSKDRPLSLPLIFVAGLSFSPADCPCVRTGFSDCVPNTPSDSRFLAPVRSPVVVCSPAADFPLVGCWPLSFCLCTARPSFGFQLCAVQSL
jgi:hypothetical protein